MKVDTLPGVEVVVVLRTFGCHSPPLAAALIMDHSTQPSNPSSRYRLRKYKSIRGVRRAQHASKTNCYSLNILADDKRTKYQCYSTLSDETGTAQIHLLVTESRRLVTCCTVIAHPSSPSGVWASPCQVPAGLHDAHRQAPVPALSAQRSASDRSDLSAAGTESMYVSHMKYKIAVL